jgi:hypothetical protein
MNFLSKLKSIIIHVLGIPFIWTHKISIPAFMILLTLFCILVLILIDPLSSAYIYFALNKKEGMDFKPVNFASADILQSSNRSINNCNIYLFSENRCRIH